MFKQCFRENAVQIIGSLSLGSVENMSVANMFKLIEEFDIRAILKVADLGETVKFMIISLAQDVKGSVNTFCDVFAEDFASSFNNDFSKNTIFARHYVTHPETADTIFEITCCSFDRESFLAILKAKYGISYDEAAYENYDLIANEIAKHTDREKGKYQLIGTFSELEETPTVVDYLLKAVNDLKVQAVLKVENLGESVGYLVIRPTDGEVGAQMTIGEFLSDFNFGGNGEPNDDIYSTKLISAGPNGEGVVSICYDVASKADYARMLAYKKGILFSEGMADMPYEEIISLCTGIVNKGSVVEGF